MYPIPIDEHLVELRKCRQCSTPFPITDTDMEFYEKVSPIFPGGVAPGSGDRVESSFPLEKGGSRSETKAGGLEFQKSQSSVSTSPIQLFSQRTSRKYFIPPPTLCPDCRQQRRLAFHNERKLYKRKCDATGKDIVSIYSPDKPYTVYHQDYWWSDAWDPLEYGRAFDFERGFFEQYKNFFDTVPKQGLINKECENSEYLNFVYHVKNCYLISAASFDEDCYFGNRVTKSKNCVDTFLVKECEQCYECIDAFNSYECRHCEHIYGCRESSYLSNCSGCSFCFLCINLTNKKYCIKNIEYSESIYLKKLKEYMLLGYIVLEKEKNDFFSTYPRKSAYIMHGDGYGNNLRNIHLIKYVFDGDDLENVSYSAFVDEVRDSMDVNYGYGNTHLQYDCLGTGEVAYHCLFSINIWPNVSNLLYCDTCTGCHFCFGCIGLRNKSYCILNRQYTKEEYEKLVPRIIEKMMEDREWGEFFPASLSPFGYNETVANEYYPMSREEVLGNLLEKGGAEERGRGLVLGEKNNQKLQSSVTSGQLLSQGAPNETFLRGPLFNWSDYEAPFPTVEKIIPANKLPDTIDGIPDDILNWAIECEVSGRPFRIIRQELEFYRKHSLPIPRRHPDVRHMDRMKLRNPRKLFERLCDSCGKKMITTYTPERPETVYCEACYEREVIS